MLSPNWKGQAKLSLVLALIFLAACESPTGRVAGGLNKASEAQTACSVGIDMAVLDKDGQQEICYDKGKKVLEFTLMNEVNNRIAAVDIEVYSIGGVFPLTQARSKEKGILFHGKAFYDDQYGDILKAKFSPIVDIDGSLIPCPNKAIFAEEIGDCG